MATQNFDKLNNLRSMPFDDYFGEMSITDKQKKDRIALAKDLEEVLLEWFYLFSLYNESQLAYPQNAKNSLNEQLSGVIGKVVPLDDEMGVYVANMSAQLVDTTTKHSDDDYYTSDDRARYVAENESNTLFNDYEYKQAIADGMTEKTWVSMRDIHVRDSHYLVDGTTIPIEDYFTVGSSAMRYPKDINGSAEEVINCRCSLVYSK